MNLEYPAWLLVWIAVPILAVCAVLSGRFMKAPWDQFAAERLRGRLIKRDHPLPRWMSLGMILAAIVAMAFTLARPQGDAGTKTETTTGRNVMIALDLSRSMRVQDVKPDRLAQAKIVIYELLETLKNDRVGVIGFAGSPFLSAPLTIDHAAVRETVEQINEEWMPVGGSDISEAVKLATRILKETGQKNNALILFSDGEENEGDLDAIIADAERAGVTIIAIGVGTEDGGFVPHPDFVGGLVDSAGNRILSRLQPDVLRKLAEGTGGRYVIAGRGADIAGMVRAATEGIDTFEMEGGETRIVIEFYQWALFPAIIFLAAAIIGGTRWRGLAGAGAALLVFSTQARADLAEDASRAFSEERFDDARDAYRALADEKAEGDKAARFRLGEGLAAYEAQDYRGARAAYSGALLADDAKVAGKAHEGMGNTLFQLGWMGLSGSRYPVGEEAPDMGKFDELVREQLKRMEEAELPESGETNEFIRIDSIILNWADAIRHYRSAQEKNPADESARRNEKLAMDYLVRLKELLEDEKEQTEEEIAQMEQAQPMPGEGPPQEGEGEGEPQEGDGGGEPREDGKGGEGEEPDENGDGGDEEPQDGDKGNEPDESDSEGEADGGADPNETPEERARRILSENADLQKGPLTPGRREFRNPDKDW